jgi:hypothetical protein
LLHAFIDSFLVDNTSTRAGSEDKRVDPLTAIEALDLWIGFCANHVGAECRAPSNKFVLKVWKYRVTDGNAVDPVQTTSTRTSTAPRRSPRLAQDPVQTTSTRTSTTSSDVQEDRGYDAYEDRVQIPPTHCLHETCGKLFTEHKPMTCFVDCGHTVYCFTCASEYYAGGTRPPCPFCDTPMISHPRPVDFDGMTMKAFWADVGRIAEARRK